MQEQFPAGAWMARHRKNEGGAPSQIAQTPETSSSCRVFRPAICSPSPVRG